MCHVFGINSATKSGLKLRLKKSYMIKFYYENIKIEKKECPAEVV
jgi:hypothetical protein